MMDPRAREALLDEVETFIQHRFNGQITRPLVVPFASEEPLSPQNNRVTGLGSLRAGKP